MNSNTMVNQYSHVKYVTNQHGHTFAVLDNDLIGKCISHAGIFAPNEIYFFQSWVESSWNIVEIGANIGNHAVYLSKMIPDGNMLCFEPQYDIFSLLVTNTVLNRCANVKCIPLAIAGESKTITYTLPDVVSSNRGGFSIPVHTDIQQDVSGNNRTSRLTMSPWNDIPETNDLSSVDLFKIDVEGMELTVLQEIRDVIIRDTPYVFIEYNTETFQGIVAMLQSIGYNLYYFNTSHNQYQYEISKTCGEHVIAGDFNIVAHHTTKSKPVSWTHLRAVNDGEITPDNATLIHPRVFTYRK